MNVRVHKSKEKNELMNMYDRRERFDERNKNVFLQKGQGDIIYGIRICEHLF